MTMIPTILLKRKHQIEREFKGLGLEKVSIRVIPRLPDRIDINLTHGVNTKFKTIHCNEPAQLRGLMKFHGVI
jgi:hypothetical protein